MLARSGSGFTGSRPGSGARPRRRRRPPGARRSGSRRRAAGRSSSRWRGPGRSSHLYQGFQPFVSILAFDIAMFDQNFDQRFAGTVYHFLLKERPVKILLCEKFFLDQDLTNSDAVIQMIGAHKIAVAEGQLTFALLALD